MNTRLKCKHGIFFCSALLALSMPVISLADNRTIPISRYVNSSVGATAEQRDPLSTIVELQFPESIQKVGEAITYLVNPYGFSLHTPTAENPEQFLLLNQSLSKVHRQLGPITLQSALAILGGKAYTVQINPVTREITYLLKQEYRQYLNPQSLQEAIKSWISNTVDKKGSSPDNLDNVTDNRRPATYGPVHAGESLSSIAKSLNMPLALNQVLVLLFDANPLAFGEANMNHLLEGAMLSIPNYLDSDIKSTWDSNAFVNQHNNAWNTNREVK